LEAVVPRSHKQLKTQPKRQDVFYAYPSHPSSLGETIQAGVKILERSPGLQRHGLRFRLWPDVAAGGTRLLANITDAIDRAPIFACDVTYLNANVAFEIGYAIGRFKRLWLSLDASIDRAPQTYKQAYTGMLGAVYARYENHEGLAKEFVHDRAWETLDKHLLGDAFRSRANRSETPTLLYVKPPTSTTAVIRSLELLEDSAFAEGLVTDDPVEVPGSTLEWYAEKVRDSDGVVVHLLSDGHKHAPSHNSKASFVAGLAHGLRRPLLMLAHEPFECPTDYTTLLRQHETAAQCEELLRDWLATVPVSRRSRRPINEETRPHQQLELRNLSLGEVKAENEETRLDNYFVETSAYLAPLEAETTLLVGRRGMGKTATLIALQQGFASDRRNHVCTIRPVGYEVDGLLKLLDEDWHSAERGFLIESLWKFLIYTELAGSVTRELEGRPLHQELSEAERLLVEYVTGNADVLLAPFSQRLNRSVGALSGTGTLLDTETQRARISEHLHAVHIGALRQRLVPVLASKQKVAVLIDNLDEPWRAGSDTKSLADLLLGLLRVTKAIVDDFASSDLRQAVRITLTILLRSDIFSHLEPLATERDKWPLQRIGWNDPALLLRVIDERLEHGGISKVSAEDVWENLFESTVVGVPVRDFIIRYTLPRPRDVIYLVKEAVAVAVNRGHARVEAADLLTARESYSRYVFGSVLAEDDPQKQHMEAVLFEFAGAGAFLSEVDVRTRVLSAGVAERDADFYVNLLCDVSFLGIRTAQGYVFAQDENQRHMLLEVGRRLTTPEGWGDDLLFQVNAAFHLALQIE